MDFGSMNDVCTSGIQGSMKGCLVGGWHSNPSTSTLPCLSDNSSSAYMSHIDNFNHNSEFYRTHESHQEATQAHSASQINGPSTSPYLHPYISTTSTKDQIHVHSFPNNPYMLHYRQDVDQMDAVNFIANRSSTSMASTAFPSMSNQHDYYWLDKKYQSQKDYSENSTSDGPVGSLPTNTRNQLGSSTSSSPIPYSDFQTMNYNDRVYLDNRIDENNSNYPYSNQLNRYWPHQNPVNVSSLSSSQSQLKSYTQPYNSRIQYNNSIPYRNTNQFASIPQNGAPADFHTNPFNNVPHRGLPEQIPFLPQYDQYHNLARKVEPSVHTQYESLHQNGASEIMIPPFCKNETSSINQSQATIQFNIISNEQVPLQLNMISDQQPRHQLNIPSNEHSQLYSCPISYSNGTLEQPKTSLCNTQSSTTSIFSATSQGMIPDMVLQAHMNKKTLETQFRDDGDTINWIQNVDYDEESAAESEHVQLGVSIHSSRDNISCAGNTEDNGRRMEVDTNSGASDNTDAKKTTETNSYANSPSSQSSNNDYYKHQPQYNIQSRSKEDDNKASAAISDDLASSTQLDSTNQTDNEISIAKTSWTTNESFRLYDAFFAFADDRWYIIRRKAKLEENHSLMDLYFHILSLLNCICERVESAEEKSIFLLCLQSIIPPCYDPADHKRGTIQREQMIRTDTRAQILKKMAQKETNYTEREDLVNQANRLTPTTEIHPPDDPDNFFASLKPGTIHRWAVSVSTSFHIKSVMKAYSSPLYQLQLPDIDMSHLPSPAPWWNDECDRSLLLGVWMEGFGFFKDVRDNVLLPFHDIITTFVANHERRRPSFKAKNISTTESSSICEKSKNQRYTSKGCQSSSEDYIGSDVETTDDESWVVESRWPDYDTLSKRVIDLITLYTSCSKSSHRGYPNEMISIDDEIRHSNTLHLIQIPTNSSSPPLNKRPSIIPLEVSLEHGTDQRNTQSQTKSKKPTGDIQKVAGVQPSKATQSVTVNSNWNEHEKNIVFGTLMMYGDTVQALEKLESHLKTSEPPKTCQDIAEYVNYLVETNSLYSEIPTHVDSDSLNSPIDMNEGCDDESQDKAAHSDISSPNQPKVTSHLTLPDNHHMPQMNAIQSNYDVSNLLKRLELMRCIQYISGLSCSHVIAEVKASSGTTAISSLESNSSELSSLDLLQSACKVPRWWIDLEHDFEMVRMISIHGFNSPSAYKDYINHNGCPILQLVVNHNSRSQSETSLFAIQNSPIEISHVRTWCLENLNFESGSLLKRIEVFVLLAMKSLSKSLGPPKLDSWILSPANSARLSVPRPYIQKKTQSSQTNTLDGRNEVAKKPQVQAHSNPKSKSSKKRSRLHSPGNHINGSLYRDDNGNAILPIMVARKTNVLELGVVVWDRPSYHSRNYIWPVGYKSQRTLPSIRDPSLYVTYTSEILDGGDSPKFRVTPTDAPEEASERATASRAWNEILCKIKKCNQVNVSGPDMYGFSDPVIKLLIQELPGAEKCLEYEWRPFPVGWTTESEQKGNPYHSSNLSSVPVENLDDYEFNMTRNSGAQRSRGTNSSHTSITYRSLRPRNSSGSASFNSEKSDEELDSVATDGNIHDPIMYDDDPMEDWASQPKKRCL